MQTAPNEESGSFLVSLIFCSFFSLLNKTVYLNGDSDEGTVPIDSHIDLAVSISSAFTMSFATSSKTEKLISDTCRNIKHFHLTGTKQHTCDRDRLSVCRFIH